MSNIPVQNNKEGQALLRLLAENTNQPLATVEQAVVSNGEIDLKRLAVFLDTQIGNRDGQFSFTDLIRPPRSYLLHSLTSQLRKWGGELTSYYPKVFKFSEDACRHLVWRNPVLFEFLPVALKTNRDFVKSLLAERGLVWRSLSESQQKDPDFLMTALTSKEVYSSFYYEQMFEQVTNLPDPQTFLKRFFATADPQKYQGSLPDHPLLMTPNLWKGVLEQNPDWVVAIPKQAWANLGPLRQTFFDIAHKKPALVNAMQLSPTLLNALQQEAKKFNPDLEFAPKGSAERSN